MVATKTDDGVGKRPKPTWIIPLVIVLAITLAIVSVLPLTHVTNKPSTPAPISPPINMYPGPPICVVGPQSLTQRLVGVGVPQSLIRPIGLGQLSSLPGNSTVIIDYSVIEPSVVVGVVKGRVELNLTSPVINLLTSLITKGDLVMLYGNSSNLPIMEYLLAYSWARRYGVLYMGRVPFDYLIALPTIPIGSNQALAAAFGGPHYLVIGPVMPRDVVEAIMTYTALKHLPASKAQTGGAGFSFSIPEANLQSTSSQDTPDVCYSIYSNYSQAAELSPGVYESSNYYFIWLLPMMGSSSYPEYGVAGYSDGNGTFYYDTCLVISNQVGSPPGPYPYVPLYVYGYVGYDPTSTMTNNGGEVLTETGTSDYYTSYKYYNESITNSIIASPACTGGDCLQPQPTSSTTSYSISVFAGFAGAEPYAGFEFTVTLPSGSSEGISLYYGPSTRAFYANVGNVTWTFNLNNANTPNNNYYNDFEDISPAAWIMPNFSNLQLQSAYLPVYVSAKVLTMSRCYLVFAVNAYEYVWVDGGWWLFAQPTSSNTGLVPSVSYGYGQPGTYVSGIKSWKTPTPKLCWP
jgi:hypothetical protein